MRPIDYLFGKGRTEAWESRRCVVPPIGCGKPLTEFKDSLSERDYEITRLCQACQDRLYYDPEEEADARAMASQERRVELYDSTQDGYVWEENVDWHDWSTGGEDFR